jgi:c-di-GMP-binding flagellar brake protein YcgR
MQKMSTATFSDLHVGLKLSLDINQGEDRVFMSLVGWDAGSFIIARSHQLKQVNITSGCEFILRFVKDGIAYGFQAEMISVQYHPVPLIFFKYPKDIRSMTFRKAKRVTTNIPARLMDNTGQSGLSDKDAKIIDLSDAGCLLEMEDLDLREASSSMQFYLTFVILDKGIDVDCIVRNIRQKDGKYLLGTEFNNISENTREMLKSFLSMFDGEKAFLA